MDGAGFVGGKYAAGSGSREKTSAGEETKGEGNMYAAKENQSYPRDDGDEGWVMGSPPAESLEMWKAYTSHRSLTI